MKHLFIAISWLICLPALAAPAVQPGEYLSLGGSGSLTISNQANNRQIFDIQTVGANGHICQLSGVINDQGWAEVKEEGEVSCRFTLQSKDNGIDVQVSQQQWEDCRHYCGMRAGFTGFYTAPQPECRQQQRAERQSIAQKHYQQKRYQIAAKQFSHLLSECQAVISLWEEGSIRNDLALTQAKLGLGKACRQTLQPYLQDSARSDQDIAQDWPPMDGDNYLAIIHAARTNLKWCDKAKQ